MVWLLLVCRSLKFLPALGQRLPSRNPHAAVGQAVDQKAGARASEAFCPLPLAGAGSCRGCCRVLGCSGSCQVGAAAGAGQPRRQRWARGGAGRRRLRRGGGGPRPLLALLALHLSGDAAQLLFNHAAARGAASVGSPVSTPEF